MSSWQNKHWSPSIVRTWRSTDDANAPCNTEYIYSADAIASIRILRHPQHLVCIIWRDGRTAEWQPVQLDIGGAYQAQFGISVSADGQALFVQTWNQGLYCLDAATGHTLWRNKSRRGITSLLVSSDTLVAHQHEHALLLLDVHTGEVLREKRPARAWSFYPLSPDLLICQTTARQWEIIRACDLETLEVIPHRLFPDASGDDPWCIRDVWLEKGQLWGNAFRSVSPYSTDVIDKTFPIPVQTRFPV